MNYNCVLRLFRKRYVYGELIQFHQPKASHKIKTPVAAVTMPSVLRVSLDIVINFSTIPFKNSGNSDKRIPSTAKTKPSAAQIIVAISNTFPHPN